VNLGKSGNVLLALGDYNFLLMYVVKTLCFAVKKQSEVPGC